MTPTLVPFSLSFLSRARPTPKRKVRNTRSGATVEESVATLESGVENAAEQGPEVKEPISKKAKVDEPENLPFPGEDEPIVMEKLLTSVEEEGKKEIEAKILSEDSKKKEGETEEENALTDEYKQAKDLQEDTSEESAVNSEEEKDPKEELFKDSEEDSDEQQLKKKKTKPAPTRILPRRAARTSPVPAQTNGSSNGSRRQSRSMTGKSVVSAKKSHEKHIQFECSGGDFYETLKTHKIIPNMTNAIMSTLESFNIRLKVTIEPMDDGN